MLNEMANTTIDDKYSNNQTTGQDVIYPSVGLGLLKDFNPSTNVYTVPVVSQSELEGKGANYISQYVPPKIMLRDGQTLVLVSKQVVSVYGVNELGNAKVNAESDGTPIIPESRNVQMVSGQVKKSKIVSESEAAEKGLMSKIGKYPQFRLHLLTGNKPTNFRAVPDDIVNQYQLTSIGQFTCPTDNAHGPYPLKLPPEIERGGFKENLSIPPPLRKTHTLENMLGTSPWYITGYVVAGILFIFVIVRLMAKYGYI